MLQNNLQTTHTAVCTVLLLHYVAGTRQATVGIESADCIYVMADDIYSNHLALYSCNSWSGVKCNCCGMESVLCVLLLTELRWILSVL